MATRTSKQGKKNKPEVELTGSLAVAGDLATQAVEQGETLLEEAATTLDTLMEATVPPTELPHAATNPDADNPLIGLYGAGELLRVLQDRLDAIAEEDSDPEAPKLSDEEQEARLQEVAELCAAHLEAFSNSEEAIAQLLAELTTMKLQERQLDAIADIWEEKVKSFRGQAKSLKAGRKAMERAVIKFCDEHNDGKPPEVPGFRLFIRTANEARMVVYQDQVPDVETLLQDHRDITTIELDESALRKALKEGKELAFAKLLEKTRYLMY